MEEFYSSIAMLTAGVALISGMINVLIGINRYGHRAELIFGILSFAIFIFLLLPPIGFITRDVGPYSFEIIFKRIFIWSYYLLLPWYIELHTGYKNRWFNYFGNGLFIVSFIAMTLTTSDSNKPAWILIALVPFSLIAIQGFVAANYQKKKYGKSESRSFFLAITAYSVLFIIGAINQLGNNFFGVLTGSKMFFPFHFNLLAFTTIMSTRLITNRFRMAKLEKVLTRNDARWDIVVDKLKLMVIELDTAGNIRMVNPFAVEKLGYNREEELKGKNWFDLFVVKPEQTTYRNAFHVAMTNSRLLENFPEKLYTRHHELLTAKWSNILSFSEQDQITGLMCIGIDVTEQNRAFEQVASMKNELEKENLSLKANLLPSGFAHDIIGESPGILYAIQKAKQVATTNAGILLTGETGTGKELFVNLIHQQSYRSNGPLIKLNCAALPADLIESELFGHEKGAFTGALQKRKGRFELANGGTIFLDEIGEMPLALQPKLLRVLQNGEFERIGGTEVIKVNVRIIAATNRDLLSEVKKGQFREDLYYRLNVYPIHIPALRERSDDIAAIVLHYTSKFSQENGKAIKNISKADMNRLKDYQWPGNIRELINVIERSVIMSESDTMKIVWPDADTEKHLTNIDEIERLHILKILSQCDWKINGGDGAAALLGLHPSTLRSRLKKMGIYRTQQE